MTTLPTRAALMLTACLCLGQAEAQSFSVSSDTTNPAGQSIAADAWFVLAPPAPKLSFSFLPSAEKMFIDPTGTISHIPALFPQTVHFRKLGNVPDFFAGRFQGAFTAWRVGDHYLALAQGYTLHSATFRDGRLFVLAKDADGDFVKLDATHMALARSDGSLLEVEPSTHSAALVSVLVDRSASMNGFDAEMSAALAALTGSLGGTGTCALYEFGSNIKPVRAAGQAEPCQKLFANYRLSPPAGGTSLFAAMDQAYRDLSAQDALSVVVILSDGAPSDSPSRSTAENAKNIPTLVLWVGDHTTDHIEKYSTAHAISKTGVGADITAFLATTIATANAHQSFNAKQK